MGAWFNIDIQSAGLGGGVKNWAIWETPDCKQDLGKLEAKRDRVKGGANG